MTVAPWRKLTVWVTMNVASLLTSMAFKVEMGFV